MGFVFRVNRPIIHKINPGMFAGFRGKAGKFNADPASLVVKYSLDAAARRILLKFICHANLERGSGRIILQLEQAFAACMDGKGAASLR